MSLAMYAAPFNEDLEYNNYDKEDNIINKKRQTHNKTQKKYSKESFNQEKVNSVLDNIHKNSKIEDENEHLGNFNPPPAPESVGVMKTISTENMENMLNKNNKEMFNVLGNPPMPINENNDNNLDLNNYKNNYGDSQSIEQYYKKILPSYIQNKNPLNRQYYPHKDIYNIQSNDSSNDVLIKKLNYMISLLEEQQDEKTNNVTEEVVLYSFLGIFIIFVVDSFARAGKYVR